MLNLRNLIAVDSHTFLIQWSISHQAIPDCSQLKQCDRRWWHLTFWSSPYRLSVRPDSWVVPRFKRWAGTATLQSWHVYPPVGQNKLYNQCMYGVSPPPRDLNKHYVISKVVNLSGLNLFEDYMVNRMIPCRFQQTVSFIRVCLKVINIYVAEKCNCTMAIYGKQWYLVIKQNKTIWDVTIKHQVTKGCSWDIHCSQIRHAI